MEELSINEKAKRYDEAVERARYWEKNPTVWSSDDICQKLFPELAESEDERIREAIIALLNTTVKGKKLYSIADTTRSEMIAWLERQGESDETKAKIFLINKGYPIDSNGKFPTYEEMYYIIKDGLEKQGEKPQGKSALEAANEEKVDNQNCVKPADIVEPKFKVGQTIKKEGFNLGFTIVKIENNFYYNDVGNYFPFTDQENWELVEQKPADESKIKPKFKTGDRVIGIVSGMQYFITEVCDDHYNTESGCIIMFCSQDNFELYEQKPAEWSEEDEENFKHLMDEIVCLGNSRNSANRLYYDRLIKFIEELKNRAQPKEKWCNKDERMLDRLIAYFEKQVAFTDDDNPRYANWLKSIKERYTWKPSDEQLYWLKESSDVSTNKTKIMHLESLYNDLKKL